MFSRKSLPLLLLLLCGGLVVAFRSMGIGSATPPTKHETILHNIGEMLSQIHYSPKKIDDNFSKEVFKKYLSEKIDQQKNIFLQSDIDQLKKYRNQARRRDPRWQSSVRSCRFRSLQKRVLEAEKITRSFFSKPFDSQKMNRPISTPKNQLP